MAFFSKLVGGALAAGGITYFYHNQITTTTTQLHNDLKNLSDSLVALSPTSSPSPSSYPLPPPTRLSLSENLKARFNEQVHGAFKGVQETDWSAVALGTWESGKEGWETLKKKLGPAPEVAVREDQKVV